MNVSAAKLVSGAAAIAGTVMVGIGTVNASGGSVNVQDAESARGSIDRYRGFQAEQGLQVPTELTGATDAAARDLEDSARLHRNAGYAALGAGAAAALAGVGSLLTHGSASNFLRAASVGAAGGAALTGLAGWKTYAGLDDQGEQVVEAVTREDEVASQLLAHQARGSAPAGIGFVEAGDPALGPAASIMPVETGPTYEEFGATWDGNDAAIAANFGPEAQEAMRAGASEATMVGRAGDGTLDWATVGRSLDENANADGIVSDDEQIRLLAEYGAAVAPGILAGE